MQETKASAEGQLDVDFHFALNLICPSIRRCINMSSYIHANQLEKCTPASEELDIYRASQNASQLWYHQPHCSTLDSYLNVSAEAARSTEAMSTEDGMEWMGEFV